MTSIYTKKQNHLFHLCETAEQFSTSFLDFFGISIKEYIYTKTDKAFVQAIALVGSIPLQTATAVSDVDFLVFVSSDCSGVKNQDVERQLNFQSAQHSLINSGATLVERGIEIDITLVDVQKVAEIYERMKSGGAHIKREEILLLDRFNTGWIYHETRQDGSNLRDNRAIISTYASTYFFTNSLKKLEDAEPAARYDVNLAIHLGRLAIEQAFLSLFSSKGYSGLGDKWLSFLTRYKHSWNAMTTLPLADICEAGEMLMYRTIVRDVDEAVKYVEAVRQFLLNIHTLIVSDRRYRIAFSLSPQIYLPSVSPATVNS